MYSDKITQNVALAVMKVMDEELSAKQKKIAVVAGDPKKIDAEDFKKLRKEDAEPLDELSESAKKSYTADDIDDHLNEAGFGGFSKKYKLKAAERRAKEALNAALKAKQKKIDAEDFKKLRKEDTVAEAIDDDLSPTARKVLGGIKPEHRDKYRPALTRKSGFNDSYGHRAAVMGNAERAGHALEEEYEPAKPNAAAVERRKKLQDIQDRKEKAKAAPSNVRKHEGSAYGGAKQKDEMDESMDVAKSLAQKGMNSEPGSMTSTTRDKDGKVTSFQVTGPMKKKDTSDPMTRARSLAQKSMKLPEETTFSGLLASIHENGLTAIHEMFVRESASEEEFNAELKIAQEKSEGKGKKAEIAKGNVQAVKNEEVEQLDELSVNTLSSYGTKAAKTTKKIYKDSMDHYAKGHDLYHKNLASGNGPYSKDADKSVAHIDKSDALLQKHKNRNSSIDLAAQKLGKKFSKGVSEETEVVEYELDVNETNGVRMHTFKERYGDRSK